MRAFIDIISETSGANSPHYTEDQLLDMDDDDLDRMAFGYASGDIIDVDPSDLHLRYEDTENAEYKHQIHGDDWVNSVNLSEPVGIEIHDDGLLTLIDGHHRRYAALQRGEKLKGVIDVKGNPVRAILARQEAETR